MIMGEQEGGRGGGDARGEVTSGEMRSSISRRVVRGVAWTLPTSLGSRIAGLIGTLLLARFLSPAEYGEVSAAAIVIGTATSVTTFGVGIYLVSSRDVSRAEAFHATCWFLAMGVLALAFVSALTGPLGTWLDAPGLARFMPLLVASALLDRVSYLPERMLVRKLRFRWLSVARALGELCFTGVSLALAATGFGAIALAWGGLCRSAFRFAAIVPAAARRDWLEPHPLRLATLRKIVCYGMNVAFTSIAGFGMRRWDKLLVSRYFSPAVMGVYNYAYNLADTPAVAIGEQMADVISASFPHVEQERRPAALVRSFTMISLVMLPLAAGLGAVAPTLVDTFFPNRWAGLGTMLVWLATLSAARPLADVVNSYLYACGRPRTVLWLEWLGLGMVVVSLSTIGRIDTTWMSISVGTAFVLRLLAALWTVRRLDGTPVSTFLRPLAGPAVTCAAMVSTIAIARHALLPLRPTTRLVLEVVIGAAVYLAGALVVFRPAAMDLLDLVRSSLAPRAARERRDGAKRAGAAPTVPGGPGGAKTAG